MPQGERANQSASVLCLGTGEGWPNGERNHSSYLYQIGSSCILIDCGESVCRSLTARKFDWDTIDAVFISHTHSDHFGGLFMMLQGMWLDGRTRDLTIHLPGHVIKPLREMLKHAYLFDELFAFNLNFSPIRTGDMVVVGKTRVRSFSNSHLAGLKASFQKKYKLPFDSFSFVLTGSGKRVVHSADLGPPTDLKPMLNRSCDLLMCEFAHFTPPDLIKELKGKSIAQLTLIHVSRAHRRRLSAIKKLFKKELPEIRTSFPKDGTRVRF